MKHRLNAFSAQASGLYYSIDSAVHTLLKASKIDRLTGKPPKFIGFIAAIAFFIMASLPVRSALALTYLSSTPLYQSGTQLNPNIGVCIHDSTNEVLFQDAAADGFTWVRLDMNWAKIETTKAHYDWANVDQVCTWCKKYNLKPAWEVDYGNTLYGPLPGTACSPEGIAVFATFAAAAATECAAQGITGAHYEIWNEPENFDWTGISYSAQGANILTAAQVAQLNNAAVGAIHAADPTALVCTSAYGSLQSESYGGGGEAALAQGLDYNGAFDAVGLHTYNIGKFYNSTEGASTPGSDRNDNPECLLAYNSSNLNADLFPQVTLSMIPSYLPGMKTYWDTESGRQLKADCADSSNPNGSPNYFAYEWVRSAVCEWMAGFQWQAHYALDGTDNYELQSATAEQAMKYLTSLTNGRSIASMSYPSFSAISSPAMPPPANAIWSLTLSGSPTVQIVWVPEGSASVPVPAGWNATDMYGNSLNSQITNHFLPMQESSGVYYLTSGAILATSPLQISQSCIDVNSSSPSVTVMAYCTLKNVSGSPITLSPDIAAQDPNHQPCDFGYSDGYKYPNGITLQPGATLPVSASRTFTTASPTGNYTVVMAYAVNGTYYNIAPILTLTVRPGIVVESSPLHLSQSSVGVNSSSPNATVTATCTLKNTGPNAITLSPDFAVRDPNGNNLDAGYSASGDYPNGITLQPGDTKAISANINFTTSSPMGKYTVFMAYAVNGTYYNLKPTLTLVVGSDSVVESAPLQLSQSSVGINALAPNATVTATCTLKNVSSTAITLSGDVVVRDPNMNNLDAGSDTASVMLNPGDTRVVKGNISLSTSSAIGDYTVFLSYIVGSTFHDLKPTLRLAVGSDPIVESAPLGLDHSRIVVNSSSPSVTVMAYCTLKNVSGSPITLSPDIAAQDPNHQPCDFGYSDGYKYPNGITLQPGATLPVSASRTFTTASPTGNYTVVMAYSVNGTYYNIAPNLTLNVAPS